MKSKEGDYLTGQLGIVFQLSFFKSCKFLLSKNDLNPFFQDEKSVLWDPYSPFANPLRPAIVSHTKNAVTSYPFLQ